MRRKNAEERTDLVREKLRDYRDEQKGERLTKEIVEREYGFVPKGDHPYLHRVTTDADGDTCEIAYLWTSNVVIVNNAFCVKCSTRTKLEEILKALDISQ